jgi:hypothetical protein
VEWIHLAQNIDQWQALVNTQNVGIPSEAEQLLASHGLISKETEKFETLICLNES